MIKSIYLMIAFITPSGQPTLVDGWYPLEIATMERCEIGRARVENYIRNVMGIPEQFVDVKVVCAEIETGKKL